MAKNNNAKTRVDGQALRLERYIYLKIYKFFLSFRFGTVRMIGPLVGNVRIGMIDPVGVECFHLFGERIPPVITSLIRQDVPARCDRDCRKTCKLKPSTGKERIMTNFLLQCVGGESFVFNV